MRQQLIVFGIVLLLIGIFVCVYAWHFYANQRVSESVNPATQEAVQKTALNVPDKITSEQRAKNILSKCPEIAREGGPLFMSEYELTLPSQELFVDPDGRYTIDLPKELVRINYAGTHDGFLITSAEELESMLLRLEETCSPSSELPYFTLQFAQDGSAMRNASVVYTVPFDGADIAVYFPDTYGATTFAYIPVRDGFLEMGNPYGNTETGKESYAAVLQGLTISK